MALKVPLNEEELIERLSELNPMNPWTKPLAWAQMRVFSSDLSKFPKKVRSILDFTKWALKNRAKKEEARLYIERLAETQRLIQEGTGYLSAATNHTNLSRDDDLRLANENCEQAQKLAEEYWDNSPKPAGNLFLPIRAKAFRVKGSTAYYADDMVEAVKNCDTAVGILKAFDGPGSFGPTTRVRAFALPAAGSQAADRGDDIAPLYEKTQKKVLDAVDKDQMGDARWATELGRWLKEAALAPKKARLAWPPEIQEPEAYIPYLNRCVHLISLAKYESNWAHYKSSRGEIDEAASAADLATRLMVEAYFGGNWEHILTGQDLKSYLTKESERVYDVQNTGARAMLWSMAAALRAGHDHTQALDSIVNLKRRDGDSGTVSGSLSRGLANLCRITMTKEANEAREILVRERCIDH